MKTFQQKINIKRLKIKMLNSKIDYIDSEINFKQSLLDTVTGGQEIDPYHFEIQLLNKKIAQTVEELTELTK